MRRHPLAATCYKKFTFTAEFFFFFKVRDRKFFRHLDSRTAMMYNKKAPNGAIFDRKDARQ